MKELTHSWKENKITPAFCLLLFFFLRFEGENKNKGQISSDDDGGVVIKVFERSEV